MRAWLPNTSSYWRLVLRDPKVFWSEFKYWTFLRKIQQLRPWLANYYPKWLVTDALIHAIVQKTRDNEAMDQPSATDIYERWYKEGRLKARGTRR